MTFYDDLIATGLEHRDRLVGVERRADRAIVTLEDPAKLNVLSAPLVGQLRAALEELVGDREIR